jgi:signal transduction histidine kinase
VSESPHIDDQLSALALHLHDRREALLSAWRRAVELDPDLRTVSTGTRAQFIDHIPAVLDAFEERLRAHDALGKSRARAEQAESAAEHGTHRWQQGYNLHETMCEWGHLHLCLLNELESYAAMRPDLHPGVMLTARRNLVLLGSEGVCASAARYAQLQQSEAASRVRDLESALQKLEELGLERAQVIRETAHDLRGGIQAIANASAIFNLAELPHPDLEEASRRLGSSIASLNKLLTDLMDHARLEAGQERRNLAEFDIAALVRQFCDVLRPLAAERNLFLKTEGDDPFFVEGDTAKVQRILQNLTLNALQATTHGGVKISWHAEGTDGKLWALCVQDTGPGFEKALATPLERRIKEATDDARTGTRAEPDQTQPAPMLRSETAPGSSTGPKEGIGLSIVKRLCELLDASIELESGKGVGTTFRLTFPRRYS